MKIIKTQLINDIQILRELAKRYNDLCHDPDQIRRRELWRTVHDLKPVTPPIYVRAFAWQEMPESHCQCVDQFFRGFEFFFRESLFRSTFGDDFIFEPWITVPAVYACSGWGMDIPRNHAQEPHGSFKVDYPIRELCDSDKLKSPRHGIDEEKTLLHVEKITSAIGDIITINTDRAPAYRMWTADLSTDLGYLRGIENVMLDMMDNPDWLHRLMGFMRDGVLAAHAQAEKAGDWNLSAHQNQAMAYSRELPDPAPNTNGIQRRQLWTYAASQEMTLVGPELWNEFMLEYQIPILETFGLSAYGCCEDLTKKISYLRKIKNLRRIAVSPFANVQKCAEQIAKDYVISYRPSPADMVSYGFDPNRVRRILQSDLKSLKSNGCCFDITLKDVETVQGDPHRIRQWVCLVRELIDRSGCNA
ncbi:MAG: hypothetical protein WC975_16765 [Phycisphaerae bacterium]